MADAQAIYSKMDQLADQLKEAGQCELADRLSYRVHKAVYTSRSEVLEMLRRFLVGALENSGHEQFSDSLKRHFEEAITEINEELNHYPPPIGIKK